VELTSLIGLSTAGKVGWAVVLLVLLVVNEVASSTFDKPSRSITRRTVEVLLILLLVATVFGATKWIDS
jgi:hypothetical protein